MSDDRRLFFPWWPARPGGDAVVPPSHGAAPEPLEEEMVATLRGAVRVSEALRETVSHCERVASLAAWLAAELDVSEEDRQVLGCAARLHEIGMVAVPPELLAKPAPLTPGELGRVRAQAWIGANIVRLARNRRAARLIEHQYSDYEELRRQFPDDGVDLLLAGILRVADVFDAMCHPRPYQRVLSGDYRAEVLRSGLGTKFHPGVTRLMLEKAR